MTWIIITHRTSPKNKSHTARAEFLTRERKTSFLLSEQIITHVKQNPMIRGRFTIRGAIDRVPGILRPIQLHSTPTTTSNRFAPLRDMDSQTVADVTELSFSEELQELPDPIPPRNIRRRDSSSPRLSVFQ